MVDRRTLLVLGVGDTLMRDEGVGVVAAEEVARRVPARVRVVPVGAIGPATLPLLEGVTHLLILDAVDAGLSPGTVVILEAPPSPSPTAQASIHSFAVGDLLVLARHRGIPLAEVVVMGIQVGEIVPGIGLSPTILASIDRARDEALRIISGWQ